MIIAILVQINHVTDGCVLRAKIRLSQNQAWWIKRRRFVGRVVRKTFELRLAIMTPFVEGWDFVETLGEGAYGE